MRARFHLHVLLDYAGDTDGAASQLRLVAGGNAGLSALVEGWRHIRQASAVPPSLAGIPHDAFRLGLQAARVDGLVLEFGVRFGVSIRQIAALANQPVHGFDSFEGLPESWGSEPRGSYSTPLDVAVVAENPGDMDGGINFVYTDGRVEFREMRWAIETIRRAAAWEGRRR